MLAMTFAVKSLLAVAGLAAKAVTPVGRLTRAVINRREIIRLGELDERALKDIGLLRSDLDGALATFWHVDPSQVLKQRADSAAAVAALRREAAAAEMVEIPPIPSARPMATASVRGSVTQRSSAVAVESKLACSA